MGHYTQVGIWILSGKEHLARAAIVESARNFGGNLTAVARDLGVSIRQIHRWADRLELREILTELRSAPEKPVEILPPTPTPTEAPPSLTGQTLPDDD